MSREMKDSGVKWIGDIPSTWDCRAIKRIAEIRTGSTPPKQEGNNNFSTEKGVPWIKAENLDSFLPIEKTSEYLTEEGTQLGKVFKPHSTFVCCIASVGKVGYSDVPCSCNQQINNISFNEDVIFWKYGFYSLMASSEEHKSRANRSVQFILNAQAESYIKLPIPHLSEQKAIAKYLDAKCKTIDAAIDKQKKIADNLKDYRQSVITDAVTKGLNPDVEKKDSGIDWIGKIPQVWSTVRFKFTHNRTNVGESIDKEYWSNNSNDTVFYTAGLTSIYTNYADFPAWKYTNTNDILLARNGTPYVYVPQNHSTYTDHIIRVEMINTINRKYVAYAIQQSINTISVDAVSIPTWSISVWNQQTIPVPPLEEQQQIVDYLDKKCSSIDAVISKSNAIIDKLEEYKKTLIYEYVTGKKEVPNSYKQ